MKTDAKRYLELAEEKRDAAAGDAGRRELLIELANAYEKLAELSRRISQMQANDGPRPRRR